MLQCIALRLKSVSLTMYSVDIQLVKRWLQLLRRAPDDVYSQTAALQAHGVCMLPEAEQLQSVRDAGSAKGSGAYELAWRMYLNRCNKAL